VACHSIATDADCDARRLLLLHASASCTATSSWPSTSPCLWIRPFPPQVLRQAHTSHSYIPVKRPTNTVSVERPSVGEKWGGEKMAPHSAATSSSRHRESPALDPKISCLCSIDQNTRHIGTTISVSTVASDHAASAGINPPDLPSQASVRGRMRGRSSRRSSHSVQLEPHPSNWIRH
jgi:hypothetical protein